MTRSRGLLRRAARLVLPAVALVLLTACRVDLATTINVAENGSGSITVVATADAAALRAAPELPDALNIDDLQAAGCFALVLEHVPAELAANLSAELAIPVIGIGAGDQCDGQVRVTADLLGLSERQPPFCPPLLAGRQLCIEALRGWVAGLQPQCQAPSPPTSPSAPAAPHC